MEVTYKGIYNFLKGIGIESELKGELAIFLGQDSRERDLNLAIGIKEAELGLEGAEDSYQIIQFMLVLPFSLNPASFGGLGGELIRINRTLEIGGFELSEPDQAVYFRYGLPVANHVLDDAIFASIIGTIETAIDVYSEQIEMYTNPKAANDR